MIFRSTGEYLREIVERDMQYRQIECTVGGRNNAGAGKRQTRGEALLKQLRRCHRPLIGGIGVRLLIVAVPEAIHHVTAVQPGRAKIGRASSRESGCQYGEI